MDWLDLTPDEWTAVRLSLKVAVWAMLNKDRVPVPDRVIGYIDEALKGGVGVYADFDQARQMENFRVLSADRSRLLQCGR